MAPSKNLFSFFVAFFAMCASAGGAIFALSGDGPAEASVVVVLVAGVIAAGILWQQGQRDLDAVLTLVGAFALCAAVCLGIYLANALEPGNAPKVALAVAAIVGVACFAQTYRRQRSASSDFPNVLAANVPANQIFETEGVQFAGTLSPGKDRKPHRVSIFLQNCFDAPTQVTIRFDPAGYEKYFHLHAQHTVTLGAAEVSRVTFPVVTPTYPATYPLYYSIEVSREEGKRVRLWRAQEATTRTKTSTTLALAAIGHLKVGGGIRFTVGPLPDDLWAEPLAAPTQETLWEPRFGTVPRVVPSF
jgi:hypothetical protein